MTLARWVRPIRAGRENPHISQIFKSPVLATSALFPEMSTVYTLGEVATHNKDKDAWLVIDGRDLCVCLCLVIDGRDDLCCLCLCGGCQGVLVCV